jgi:hypothetical protein
MKKRTYDPNWGGLRAGAGRPRTDAPRCACGEMTAKRAQHTGHRSPGPA